MKQLKNYRQGDVAYIGINKLPENLVKEKTQTILQNGSGGNPHTFKGGKFYAKKDGDFILGYLKAKDTRLFHLEHGPKAGYKIKDGIYEVRKQSEDTIAGLKPVID